MRLTDQEWAKLKPMMPELELEDVAFFLNGGAVRDLIRGRYVGGQINIKDIDLTAVTSLTFSQLLRRVEKQGKIFQAKPEFLTIRCNIKGKVIDIVMARQEGPYTDGRHPDWVHYAKSLHQDSLRRDFRINAMYLNISTGEIIDYHKGVDDIRFKRIVTVDKPEITFKDDWLRILRAVRFAVTLGYTISQGLLREMRWHAENLKDIPMDRIRDELNKALKADADKTMWYLRRLNLIRLLDDKGLNFQLTSAKI